ncbi:DUF397 domain-containing protein [Streptomyces sp. NPDC001634]|uniref:DUF397 domain-containing protein n=1 Tax=Streptomyces sp. NPDC001634 TaxID=3154390 RepID=UPI00331835A1
MSQAEDEPLTWATSTYTNSGSCVEWARPPAAVLVRDTKCRERARLRLTEPAWQAFADWTKTATV